MDPFTIPEPIIADAPSINVFYRRYRRLQCCQHRSYRRIQYRRLQCCQHAATNAAITTSRTAVTTSTESPPRKRQRGRHHSSSSESSFDSGTDSDDSINSPSLPGSSSDDSDSVPPDSLNFSNSSSSDSDDDRVLSSVSKRVHSVRVGSKIMKKFDNKFYVGKITELPRPGERYYCVKYEDGDSETMIISEVLQCIDLFIKNNK